MNYSRLTFIFIVLGLFFPFLVQAQKSISKIHPGISLAPKYSTAFFKDDLLTEYHASLGFMVECNAYYQMNDNIQFLTGIEYSKSNFEYRDYSPLFPEDVINGEADVFKSYWNYNYSTHALGVPLLLKLNMKSKEKPNYFFLLGGLRLQYKFGSSGYVQLIESGHHQEKEDLDDLFFKSKKFHGFGTFGIGYEWSLNNHKLCASPIFEYSPGWLYQDQHSSAVANAHPAYIGLRVAYY